MVLDTGATYTTLPATMLNALSVRPLRKRRLRLANGRIVERRLGEVGLEMQEGLVCNSLVSVAERSVC